jgi:phosphoribosylformylglycinamidine synthase II
MLVVVQKGREAEVEAIFGKWDIHCALIGEVTAGPNVQYYWHGELIGDLPAEHLVLGGGAPVYHREWSEPASYAEYQKFNVDSVSVPADLKAVAAKMVTLPNLASKRWIYEQYDSMVGTINRSTNGASDASIVNLRGTNRALAMTVDCNSRYVHADPEVGAMIAVAENARNITCSGGTPSAITNCLNFGNPYNPEVYWQFVGAIKGMGKACLKFETPVTGGNVSFYNQTAIGNKVEPVFPTPTIAMIGLVDDVKHVTTLGFKAKGDLIYLIGSSRNDLASSQYLVNVHGVTASPAPYFDLDEEYVVQRQVAELIREGVVASAHDVSEGGLFVTLLESAMAGALGFDLTTDAEIRPDAFLFGDHSDGAAVAMRFDDQIYRQIKLVLKADFAADFFHQIGLRGFHVQVHVTAFLLIINPRAKQSDLRTLTQHRVHGALYGVDLGGGEAHVISGSFFGQSPIHALKARQHRHELSSGVDSGLQSLKALCGVVRVIVGKLVADLAQGLPFVSAGQPTQLLQSAKSVQCGHGCDIFSQCFENDGY